MHQYPQGWYAVAESREVGRTGPVGMRRFGVDLVFWRENAGNLVVQRDLCPHRSVKLSLGSITKSGTIACPFHGMQFDAGGACRHVPETGKPASALCLQTFWTVERYGFVWLWIGDEAPQVDQVPWFDELDDSFDYATIVEHVDCHITRAIENQLDFVHLAFVHRTTIGRGFDPTRKATVESDDSSVKFSVQQNEKFADSSICFKMPNIWMNTITKRFRIMLAFCPIDENRTRIYLRTYQALVTWPLLGSALTRLMNQSNRIVFKQDSRIVNSHPAGASTDTGAGELLFAGDGPIRHLRRLWEKAQKHRVASGLHG
ncbi:MAG: aromatic ring-hydroxylating dioxygenase subunit alpha [Deltaproteobacteria bacterium]|nr:aromatic ring-hydroxylating dioxygenase subunit alpha [Deltaproteobacteria bacterium]